MIIILMIDPQQAFAATGTLADRMCIETKGVKNQLLSAEELISCSGQDYHHKHVHSFETWEYLKSHGVVSGGKYNSDDVRNSYNRLGTSIITQ